MFIRFASAALAAVFLTGAMTSDAYAGHRKRHGVIIYDQYDPGPRYVRRPGFLRLMFGGYGMTRDDYEELYGSDQFDESYYDPRFDDPVVKPKPRKVSKAKAPVSTPAKKPLATASIAKPATTETATTASAGGPMTCGKASGIISGYGFSSVKPSDCTGEVFAFNATRDGKPFSIKLNAASGELTEVKKLQ